MDNALRVSVSEVEMSDIQKVDIVLILVLMDNALRVSVSEVEMSDIQKVDIVLILVLMDNALRDIIKFNLLTSGQMS